VTTITYDTLRLVHILCAGLSLGCFVLRGLLMLRQSPWLQHRLTRTLPHLNDTVLLAAALSLSVRSQQYPWTHPWLAAKLIALLLYIGLGFVAFRFGKTARRRALAWARAIGVLLWMISVARLRDPLGALALLPVV